jgi:hypothetical protein
MLIAVRFEVGVSIRQIEDFDGGIEKILREAFELLTRYRIRKRQT